MSTFGRSRLRPIHSFCLSPDIDIIGRNRLHVYKGSNTLLNTQASHSVTVSIRCSHLLLVGLSASVSSRSRVRRSALSIPCYRTCLSRDPIHSHSDDVPSLDSSLSPYFSLDDPPNIAGIAHGILREPSTICIITLLKLHLRLTACRHRARE